LKWFKIVFEDKSFLKSALSSIEIAILSASGSVLLGMMAASATSSVENYMFRNSLRKLVIIPLVLPEIVIGFSLLLLFIAMEKMFGFPKRGMLTVMIGHVMLSITYVYRNIKSYIISVDRSISDAAQDLGARSIPIFLHIKVPIFLKPAVSGWLLAFTLSLDDLVVASFLTGPGSTTLPLLIFSNIKIGITPAINAFATLFMGLVAVCVICGFFKSRKRRDR
jgi:putrescine transport system permease protein